MGAFYIDGKYAGECNCVPVVHCEVVHCEIASLPVALPNTVTIDFQYHMPPLELLLKLYSLGTCPWTESDFRVEFRRALDEHWHNWLATRFNWCRTA